ncbi:iridoid synthase [Prunus yedoensis var. nudiflora]|uniref:Iridoid synthase n=1 Tax=Prunus yedoensis var. nudiflora TaxID=2094558 RepID=A0A314XXQ7_PRUYE|nr:iridoid synthase [Prunus yedoensis var. nudiflora]
MAAEETKRPEAASIEHVAAIFGVTGLVGKVLAKELISKSKWKVYGIARNPMIISNQQCSNFHFIQCDLLNPLETQQRLSLLQDVTHVFWITWASQYQLDSIECCEQNKAMMSNALNAIIPMAKALKHVSLQTGMKHYVSLQGPFDEAETRYYNENSPRVNAGCNFYYVLEDLLKERLDGKIAWTVHRPGLLIGSSSRTLYNFMGSLCVYGAICKHLNLPFVFGGTKKCWEETCIDGSDARLVAKQHIWAATNDDLNVQSTDGQSFNAINGPSFTWKEIWTALAEKFGLEVVPENAFSEDFWYSKAMADKKEVWKEIVAKEGLMQIEMEDLANWAFLDVLFRCPFKLLGTRNKVDQLGFTVRYKTLDSILYWIDCMRDEKLIP